MIAKFFFVLVILAFAILASLLLASFVPASSRVAFNAGTVGIMWSTIAFAILGGFVMRKAWK